MPTPKWTPEKIAKYRSIFGENPPGVMDRPDSIKAGLLPRMTRKQQAYENVYVNKAGNKADSLELDLLQPDKEKAQFGTLPWWMNPEVAGDSAAQGFKKKALLLPKQTPEKLTETERRNMRLRSGQGDILDSLGAALIPKPGSRGAGASLELQLSRWQGILKEATYSRDQNLIKIASDKIRELTAGRSQMYGPSPARMDTTKRKIQWVK